MALNSIDVLLMICWLFRLAQSDILGSCDTCTDSGTSYILRTDPQINDCDPTRAGDSLIYYCCDGVPRYCLSYSQDCYWAKQDCPSKYSNYTCQLALNSPIQAFQCAENSDLLASDAAHSEYWYCDKDTNQFYFSHTFPNPQNRDRQYAPIINDSCTSSPTAHPSAHPSAKPSTQPTTQPSAQPSANPSANPTRNREWFNAMVD